MNRFNLSAFAVRERAITLFLIIAITAAGIYAFLNLGRAEDPPFTIKQIVISAAWPGATAQEMQELVAEPYEKRLQELRWYDRVETIARPGLVFMTLTLKDNIPPRDVPEQFYQARKKLGDEAHKLPQGTLGPFINDEYSDVTFSLYALHADGLPSPILTREAENVRQKLLKVPGVKKVDIFGERPERIFVEISNQRLANLGVNAYQILDALHKQNALTPAGAIATSGPQMFIRLDGAYDSLAKIRNTPIVAAGHSFKLSDIAEVKRGYEDPATFLIRHDGKPALVLGVVMQEGWNGLKLGEALETEEKKISRELALGYQLRKITDQSVNIKESVNEFMLKFFVALGVVMLVSLLSLGWRVGIVVAAAVPLTLAAVLVVMMITDRMFDRITLGALIISLGLLVDDAIIAIEIMVVKMEEGLDRIQAAAYAWSSTAAPMLAGTLITIIGFTPVGFAKSTAGEYAGNIFWIVGFALLTSWFVAVFFTPYLGVKLLPAIKPVEGGYEAIYSTPNYRRFRSVVTWAVVNKKKVASAVLFLFLAAIVGMVGVKQQFFPSSDRPEMLVEIQMPYGTTIEATSAAAAKVEQWLKHQPESKVVTSYIGQGAPRFFLAFSPELPDPSFAKIIVLTPDQEAREMLKSRLRKSVQNGLAPEAKVRATQLVFGPPSPFPVAFRVMGSDAEKVRDISSKVADLMRKNPHMRQVNQDWGNLQPSLHFVLDQERLRLIGMTPHDVAEQLQFLLTGVPVTQVRENSRTVDIIARSAGGQRLDPAHIADFNLTNKEGRSIPLSQVGKIEFQSEEPLIRRRDRNVTITVRGDIDEALQPPQVSTEVWQALAPIIQALPSGYKIEMAGSIEEADKANKALLPIFPIMFILILTTIIFQVRSFSAMTMVFLTGPLGLVGTVPILLLFHQPFGFNAILGLIGLSGILMRNTLILIDQIKHNEEKGLDTFNAVVEATVQRARPVVLTALAAILAFIPLTSSVFWGSMAYTLIGGTAVGTLLTLVFLPTLYAIWFKVKSR